MKSLIFSLVITSMGLTCYAQKKITEAKHNVLKGHYIMDGATCAGFDFVDAKTVLWYAELQCNYADTMRLKWISNDMFITMDSKPFYENCPPRVFIYKVLKNDGKQLALRSVWTGWHEGKDMIETYRKR